MAKRFSGTYGPSKGFVLRSLLKKEKRLVVVCKDRATFEALSIDIPFFVGHESLYRFPAWDTLPFEQISPQLEITAERIKSLLQFSSGTSGVFLTSIQALLQRVLPLPIFTQEVRELRTGRVFPRDTLVVALERCGFTKVSLVEKLGEYAVRGSVVDYFPSTSEYPVRVEFFDDEVESLKTFDPSSQRSIGLLAFSSILPLREFFPFAEGEISPELLQGIKERGTALEVPLRELTQVVHSIENGISFQGIETLTALLSTELVSPTGLITSNTPLALIDMLGIRGAQDEYLDLVREREERFSQDHILIPEAQKTYDLKADTFTTLKRSARVYLDHLEVFQDDESPVEHVRAALLTELRTRLQTQIGSGNALAPLQEAVERWRKKKYKVAFIVGSEQRAQRLQRLLLELGLDSPIHKEGFSRWYEKATHAPVVILIGELSEGVELGDAKLVLIAEQDIFHERSHRVKVSSQKNLKKLLNSLAQLKENDFVVHADYGVGLYQGLRHLTVEGEEGDFLQIEYADSKLYLPVQHIGRVQKFIGAEGQAPQLDKLSSPRWTKTKQKVRESVETLAGELIKLYATRSVTQGWQYEPFGAEDERFSDGFPYSETPDQMKAITEVLEDMSSDKPMDRLVCGDVGFGKTEVAIRAAFKCTQHARQVAVLVPTTVLVEQHRRNFEERFLGYPVKVAGISRFYSTSENRETLERLRTGDVDIIIGTQKLLSRDVVFRDLGLLIVDEEHRFGVKQKEQLKQLKTKVDVLTLTATPIPRTLHMSLLGIRDVSVISTPPVDRRVIRTYIAQYDPSMVRDAILKELGRNGQCFYIHNRIRDIQEVTAQLAARIPEARFEFGHGQMTEHQLERIMDRFVKHEFDVLVSTTIVESGLDIPNANTIIVDDAHMYGLAQLYQIRGRVGRSSKQAYAYLFVPRVRKLGSEAQQRLKVLQSLDDIGIGFNLALRDLEIRGAGNLLGKEQSGNVLAVGFDLYTQILKEAVSHLKGEPSDITETIDPEVKHGIPAFVPEFYIPDISERLVLYQRLASLTSLTEADELREEIRDRFGILPTEVEELVEVMRLRELLKRAGIVRAEVTKTKLLLAFSAQAPVDLQKLLQLVKSNPEKYTFGKNLTLSVELEKEHLSASRLYPLCQTLLEKVIRPQKKEKAETLHPEGFGKFEDESRVE